MTRKPKLNPRQQAWVDQFIAQYPGAQLVSVYRENDGGDRTVVLEWTTSADLTLPLGCTDPGMSWTNHQLIVTLRQFGDLRKDSQYRTKTTYPHCELKPREIVKATQMSFLALSFEVNPAKPVKYKPPKQRLPRQEKTSPSVKPIQHKLPLTGVAAKLAELNEAKGLPPMSEQSLLSLKVDHWSLDQGRKVELPEAIVDLLKTVNATTPEWETAVDLYEVAGLTAALIYAEGIPVLRAHFGQAVNQVPVAPVQPAPASVRQSV